MPEFVPTKYDTDLADDEWALIASLFEAATGRQPTYAAREHLNATLYVMRSGCPWRLLPNDYPPWNTVYKQQARWSAKGLLAQAMSLLRPVRHGDDYMPTVGIVDSSFVEGAYGGPAVGISGHKRAHGTNIHVIIDAEAYPLFVAVEPSNRADSTVLQGFIQEFALKYPTLQRLLADKAYRGSATATAALACNIAIDVSSPPLKPPKNFAPQPLRWKVETFFAWLFRWRRLAKNWCTTAEGFLREVQWVLLALALRRYPKLRPSPIS